ncbi:unnamed protein product, partial [Nesidiocoris tenuis]
MPSSAVVILAGLDRHPGGAVQVCHVQWFLALVSWMVTVLSLASAAAENYARLCLSPQVYAKLTTARITTAVLSIWIVCTVLAAMQVRLAKAHPSFKPPVAFSWDYSLMWTNMYSYFLFFAFWLPFGIILFVGS